MTKRKLSLRAKLISICAVLVVLPVLIVGGFSLYSLDSFGTQTSDDAYAALRGQAEKILQTGVQADYERVDGLVRAGQRGAKRLANSANMRGYVTASQGRNDLFNSFSRRELNRIARGLVTTCESLIEAGAPAQPTGTELTAAQKVAAEKILDIQIGKSGYVFVLDSKGTMLVHPKDVYIGKHIVRDMNLPLFGPVLVNRSADEVKTLSYTFEGRDKMIAYVHMPKWDWIVCASAYWDDLSAEAATASLELLKGETLSSVETSHVEVDGHNQPIYSRISYVDRTGREVFSAQYGKLAEKQQDWSNTSWFRQAASSGERTVINTGVVNSVQADRPEMRIVAPVRIGGSFEGAIVAYLDWQVAWELLKNETYGKTGYAYIVNDEGVLISHPEYTFSDGENLTGSRWGELATMTRDQMLQGQPGKGEYQDDGQRKLTAWLPLEVGDKTYAIAACGPKAEFMALADQIRTRVGSEQASTVWTISIVAVILAALGVGVGILLAGSVARPIRGIIESLNVGGEQVTSAAEELSGSSQSLAEGASEQAASLEETSASIEEMSSAVKSSADNARAANETASENSRNARKAQDLSGNAAEAATDGEQAVSRMNEAIEGIKKSSEETAKIIKTIDEIAFQTNLLALNAAVEAARAGEAGKGFAVVAEEVRNLAQRSAQAAKNTTEMIEQSLQNAENGVAVSGEVTDALSRISQAVADVRSVTTEVVSASENQSEIIAQVAGHADEQAKSIEQIAAAVAQMDEVTQRNAANAEESASASEELSGQAEQLRRTVLELVALVEGSGSRKESSAGRQKNPQGFRVASSQTPSDKSRSPQRARPNRQAGADPSDPPRQDREAKAMFPLDQDEEENSKLSRF